MARYRFNFWLDSEKDEELLVAETIDELKTERSFTRTVREGIKLVYSLRQRRVDVLEKLFPWIKDYYQEKLAQEDSPATQEFTAILKQQAQILERLAAQQATPALPASAGDHSRAAKGKSVSDDDNDLIEIKTDTQNSARVAQNFLNSLAALSQ